MSSINYNVLTENIEQSLSSINNIRKIADHAFFSPRESCLATALHTTRKQDFTLCQAPLFYGTCSANNFLACQSLKMIGLCSL